MPADGAVANAAVSPDAAAYDIAKLGVCFGGFSPMALSDGASSAKQVDESRKLAAARREASLRAAAIEAARASEPLRYSDADGALWQYVVLDGCEVRIEKCLEVGDVSGRLRVPCSIGGMPVVALAADACAYLKNLTEVVCSDPLVSIGFCAFRECPNLRRTVLPRGLTEFSSEWFRNCRKLEYMELPGRLECVTSSVFDLDALCTLVIGEGTSRIAPGAFAKSKLQHDGGIQIAAENPYLQTDGWGIYTADGGVLLALAVPCESYRVAQGCKAIAKKACAGREELAQVQLPDGLEVIGGYAFAHTALAGFEAPAGLQAIAQRAFFHCENLEYAHVGDALSYVGDNAFTDTAISALRLPAALEYLEYPVAQNSRLTYAGEDATFSIEEGARLRLDSQGGLYCKTDDGGMRLERLENPMISSYEVVAGTTEIAPRAFANHENLCEVVLPDGLLTIGDAAFKSCFNLHAINLPDGLRSLGEEAFLDANIEKLCLPATLEHIGNMALTMYGVHRDAGSPTLTNLEVESGNERFRMEGSLLIERCADGDRVIHCTDSQEVVVIPDTVMSIGPYALSGVRNIRELRLTDRVTDVGMRGLAVACHISLIHVDVTQPIDGRSSFDFRFPHTDRGEHQMYLALTVPRFVDVKGLFEHYDNTIMNASNFDSVSDGGLNLYEKASRIIARLTDPVCLTSVNRSLAERFLNTRLADVCVEAARHDDRRMIDDLCDLGFLDGDNLVDVIDRVGVVQDASMTGYLLELRRRRFGCATAFDFDL